LERQFLRLLVALGAVIGLSAVTVLIAVVFAFVNPQGAWKLVQHRVVPSDLNVSWSKAEFKPDRHGRLHWSGVLHMQGVHIEKADPRISLPIDELSIAYSLSFFRPSTRLTIHELKMHSPGGGWYEAAATDVKNLRERNAYQILNMLSERWPFFRDHIGIESMSVILQNFEFRSQGEAPVVARFSFESGQKDRKKEDVYFRVDLKREKEWANLSGTILPSQINSEAAWLQADGVTQSRVLTGQFKMALNSNPQKAVLKAQGKGTATVFNQHVQLEPDLNFSLDQREWVLDLKTPVAGLPEPFEKISSVTLSVHTPNASGQWLSSEPSTVKITAPLNLLPVGSDLLPALEQSCNCKWPKQRQVEADGRLWLKSYWAPSGDHYPYYEINFKAEPTHNDLFNLQLAGSLRRLHEHGRDIDVPSIDSSLNIKSFQHLRDVLHSKGMSLSPPFDEFDGPVSVIAKAPVIFNGRGSHTSVDFTMNLASDVHALKTDGHADFDLNADRSILDILLSFKLHSAMFDMPNLDLIRDFGHVVSEPVAEKKKFKLRLTLAASTEEPNALKFLSPLAVPHVPITMEAVRTNKGDLSGYVKVEPFQAHYAKRDMIIEQLRILFDRRDDANYPVDGRLRFDSAQHRIFVGVSGTLRSPSIELKSEPSLSRSDIVSVLLYGRETQRLNAQEKDIANSFEAAMVDRTIGLFGLWTFVSRSVGNFAYDSEKKTYRATVLNSDGNYSEITSQWEENAQTELRKRLTSEWILVASWVADPKQPNLGQVAFRWEKR
jgi:hypothetical protein